MASPSLHLRCIYVTWSYSFLLFFIFLFFAKVRNRYIPTLKSTSKGSRLSEFIRSNRTLINTITVRVVRYFSFFSFFFFFFSWTPFFFYTILFRVINSVSLMSLFSSSIFFSENAAYRDYVKAHAMSCVAHVANSNWTFFMQTLSNVFNEIILVLFTCIVAVAKLFVLQTQTQ